MHRSILHKSAFIERLLYMRLPFLASCIVFIIWLSYEIKKSRRAIDRQQKTFWERERKANRTRKKPLDTLDYIAVPLHALPMDLCNGQPQVDECLDLIRSLSGQKIVNFTGYSNTDLKLMYGAPNITLLSEYDQNYTLLVRTLQKWASLLYEQGYQNEAKTILEYAVSIRTDVSGTYKLLASIYHAEGAPEKIDGLIETAMTLNSSMKDVIVRTLRESDQSDG